MANTQRANTKKTKKVKKTARLLDEKERQLNLEKFIEEFGSSLESIDSIVEKSEELMDLLEEEEDLVKRVEIELQLEALKYLLDDMDSEHNNVDDTSYPETGDPNFALKIARKREFNQYKISNDGWSSRNLEDISKKCSWRDLSQTQKFLQNFISPMTPYNGLLLFHGVGVGKTCSSITIAEGFKEYLEEKKKKVYVLLKPTIRENYKRSIIDTNKINVGDDNQCTGDTYFEEMGRNFVNKKFKKKEEMTKMERRANKIIGRYYDFFGYGEFVSIYKSIENSIKVKNAKEKMIILQNKLREKFSDSVIIIDEAHNITPRDKSYNVESKKTKKGQTAGGYNDFTEGLTLTKGESEGKEVSGILMKIIRMVENMKLILLSATPMYNEAPEIVYLLNLLLANDKKPLLKANEMFNGGKITEVGKRILRKKAPGYVSYLRSENPINYPYKLEPDGRDVLEPSKLPIIDIKGNTIPEDKRIKHMKFVSCPMSGFQYEVYQKYFDLEDSKVNSFDTVGSQICNITFNEDLGLKKEDMEDVSEFYSDKGFKKIIKPSGKKYNFVSEDFSNYFSLDNLKNVAPKIKKIVENVTRSHGINFVYSQFKNSGVYPIAFALEMEGYVNYNGKTLLNLPSGHPKKMINGKQAKYLIITGESSEDFNKYKKDREHLNEDGSELKVILGTQAASEGLNIFNVRGIHILDPWHHLNRLEQIVGRGLRSCSHRNLSLEERNLTLFLYVITYPRNDKETLDLKMYRKAEEKTVNVAEVQRELKILAVDCNLNKEGNIYMGENWEIPIRAKNLFGEVKEISIGDKAGSRICDYMEDCNYTCAGGNLGDEINNSTYSLEFSKYDIKGVIKIIKKYFKKTKRVNTKFEDVFKFVKEMKPDISPTIVSKALSNIINKEIKVLDRMDREGLIIYRGKNYIFQPLGLSDTITVIERRIPTRLRTRKVGLNVLLDKKTKRKEAKSKLKVRLSVDIFMELLSDVNDYINRLGIKSDGEIMKIIMEEVFDRFDYKNKIIILTNILEKLSRTTNELPKRFNEDDGRLIIDGATDLIMSDFSLGEDNSVLMVNLLDFLIQNKFFYVDNILGFKISKENTIKYYKLKESNIEELSDEEYLSVKVSYVNVLKEIKMSGKSVSDLYGFIVDEKRGITFKILEKRKDTTKASQQAKGLACSSAKVPILKEMLKSLTGKEVDVSGKKNICSKISFILRKMNHENRENKIYFYGLDDYLELK